MAAGNAQSVKRSLFGCGIANPGGGRSPVFGDASDSDIVRGEFATGSDLNPVNRVEIGAQRADALAKTDARPITDCGQWRGGIGGRVAVDGFDPAEVSIVVVDTAFVGYGMAESPALGLGVDRLKRRHNVAVDSATPDVGCRLGRRVSAGIGQVDEATRHAPFADVLEKGKDRLGRCLNVIGRRWCGNGPTRENRKAQASCSQYNSE